MARNMQDAILGIVVRYIEDALQDPREKDFLLEQIVDLMAPENIDYDDDEAEEDMYKEAEKHLMAALDSIS